MSDKSDNFDERFSALVDGELSHLDDVVSRLERDEALQARWVRYHMIRDVLSGHRPEASSNNLAERVSQALHNEPAILAPIHRRSRSQHWLKQVAGFGIAAAVTTVAILTVQNTAVLDLPTSSTSLAVASAQNPYQSVSQTAQSRLDAAVESKLSGYLVNHNEYSVTAKMQGMLPYVRIVSVTPNERIVVQGANEK